MQNKGKRGLNTTPGQLVFRLVLVIITAVVLCLVSLAGVEQHRHAFQTVGYDAAPSVTLADDIKVDVQTMDADVLNELLTPKGQSAQQWIDDYNKSEQKLSAEFVSAAKNITYGDAEQLPLNDATTQLGLYYRNAQASIDAHRAGDEDKAEKLYFTGCYTVMTKQLLPAVDRLRKANDDELNKTFNDDTGASRTAYQAVLAVGVFFLVELFWLQRFLAAKFHRLINIPATIAMVVVAVFTFKVCGAFSNADTDMRALKVDAYDSVHALADARADSYDANLAESRWLFDRDSADEYATEFTQATAMIAKYSNGQTLSKALVAAKTVPLSATSAHKAIPNFSGHLADELGNLTFPGEREAATDTLKKWGDYLRIDSRIRQLETGGHHDQAVALCLGTNPGESDWAFSQYDEALTKTLDINDKEFKRSSANGFADIGGLVILIPVACLIIVALVVFGLHLRFKDYN